MSSFKIKTITIDHIEKNIRISRSITINENYSDRYICIPDEIANEESVEILDIVENGSTLLHSEKPSFPEDLKYFKNKTFKIQMLEGNHIIGKLIESSNETKSTTINVESYHSFKGDNSIPSGILKLEHSKILSYFLLSSNNQNNKDNGGCDDDFYVKNNCEKITKIEINNNKVKRDIVVNYNIPIQKQHIEFGHFIHLVKGLKSIKQLYCKANLKDDLPITIVTEYKWKPFIDIYESDNVQLRVKTLANKKTVVYKVENLKCYNNITTNIQINKFQTTANRAILVYPGGPLQVSIYFKNNSKLFLTKTRCKVIEEQTDDHNEDEDEGSDEEDDSEIGNIDHNSLSSEYGNTIEPYSSSSSSRNSSNNSKINVVNTNPIRRFSSGLFASQLLNIVKPNSIGIISFTIPTEKLKLFRDIGHQALFETRVKESNINQIKVSNIFTILETETLNKITYQVVNITQHPIKLIIYTGFGIVGTDTPLNEYTKVYIPPIIDENNNNNNNRIIEKIDETLYLIQNCQGFSIVNFDLYNSKCKQLMTNSRLPNETLTLIENLCSLVISYSSSTFKCYDIPRSSRNVQDAIFKSLGSITLEEKTSSYFNKPYLPGPLSNYLFDQTVSSKSYTSVLSDMASCNPRVVKLGLFDSENPQSQSNKHSSNNNNNKTSLPSNPKYSSFVEGSFSSRDENHTRKSSRIIS
ncbi:hypothetical protein ACTFIV_007137 [Dictyostelium citrinum]